MELHVLFIQRKESYHEEHAPEALVIADEYTMDENPEWFEKRCEEELKSTGDDILGHAVVIIEVDQDIIRKACLPPRIVLPSKIKSPTQ